MASLTIAGIVFACTFGSAVLGLWLSTVLPASHLSSESKEVIKVGTGLIASMAALVLGLLVASAKSEFDAQRTGFQQLSTNLVVLDRTLAHYGPEAQGAREALRNTVSTVIDRLWPKDGSQADGLGSRDVSAEASKLYASIRDLTPQNDNQRTIQSQAMQIANDLGRTRWALTQQDENSIPLPFLIVLVLWLSFLFASFGLFSPRNLTVIAVLLFCALSLAGAVFLIVDLDRPFDGLIRISGASLRGALTQLGQP